MTAPLTMNRVIHGAVRRDLDRLAAALDGLREGDTARAAALDAHIWPVLERLGADVDLLRVMESEHAAMAAALADTDTALAALARSASAADAEAARAGVARTREVVDRHLAHEEDDVEPVLARYEHTAEWKAVEKELRSQPPATVGSFFAWVTDGMSEDHRAYFRNTVPPPVVFVFSRTFGRRYHRKTAPAWR